MLNIVTRCSRIENLLDVQKSFKGYKGEYNWTVIIDTGSVKDIATNLLKELNCNLCYTKSDNDLLYPFMSKVIKELPDGYVYILDDDNIIHPDFFPFFDSIKDTNSGYVFNQFVNYKDFSNLEVRLALPENMKVGGVDAAQFLFPKSFFTVDFEPDYCADGIFIEEIYPQFKDEIIFIDKTLCYYNYLEKKNDYRYLCKVLHIGKHPKKLETTFNNVSYDTKLNVFYRQNDKNILNDISLINPDAIISEGNYLNYSNLQKLPLDIRSRWLSIEEESEVSGDTAYLVGMNYILNRNDNDLVSFFTSAYNTGEAIIQTYNSLYNQVYTNWEWVVVDDSTDNDSTYKILKKLASIDHRVKVYSFKEKSKGIIGEAKYRAAGLTRGVLLAELDHDDVVTPDCAELLVKAMYEYPDAGFYYTDCGEVTPGYEAITYGDFFAMGYGSYSEREYNGHKFLAQNTVNINPLTIRHIVGVPNHIRCWRRDIYFSAGGYNRKLPIADDYELVVRTFLKTKFVKIPKMCYIQYRYDNGIEKNSQVDSLPEIQRRVGSISDFYKIQIKERFEELGVVDWAYEEYPDSPTMAQPKYGELENYVNYILNLN